MLDKLYTPSSGLLIVVTGRQPKRVFIEVEGLVERSARDGEVDVREARNQRF